MKLKSEYEVSEAVRVAASVKGWRLWRNNVGAGVLNNGKFVRWGLANSSAMENAHVKSADLIGIRPVVITPNMIGQTIGQFVSIETKKEGWVFNDEQPHEIAQDTWRRLIVSLGGLAIFSTGELE